MARFNGTNLTISSSNNTYFRINPGTSTATADIGFGTSGAAFTSSLTVPQALNTSIDSTGGTTVSALSFAGLSDGTDSQTITVSAPDPTGTPQTATITLQNNAQGRNGRSIDETIAAINAQLQQSGTTLQQITAVKENVGGVDKIGFLSSLRSFNVAASDSAGGSGLNGGVAISEASYAMAPLVNVSVDTKDAALLALTAITGAVNALGAAQAVVGKAENQLNYAINLSQSEVTNFSSAESQIRDTDVAADASNLTKAQILAQASVAAMAQANSAAQNVLALLKGSRVNQPAPVPLFLRISKHHAPFIFFQPGPKRSVSGKMPAPNLKGLQNDLHPDQRKLPCRPAEPERQHRIPEQNHSAVDLRLSDQPGRRRRGRFGRRQQVPQHGRGTDPGRGERQ